MSSFAEKPVTFSLEKSMAQFQTASTRSTNCSSTRNRTVTFEETKQATRGPTRTTVTIEELEHQSQTALPAKLPPRDRGRAAITALLAAFFIDAVLFAILQSYGIFQEYYTANFAGHSDASWIGALSNGVVYFGAPAVTYCTQELSLPRKLYISMGIFLCSLSLLLSAFISNIPGLIIVQGLMYGLGVLLVESPLLIIVNTWFDERRGLAYGLLFGGTDLLGALVTLLTAKLLHVYNLRATFLVYFTTVSVCAAPAIIILQERLQPEIIAPSSTDEPKPITRTDTALSKILRTNTGLSVRVPDSDLPHFPSVARRGTWPAELPRKRYYQRSVYYLFMFSSLMQSCASYLPFIYLPAFAIQAGHSKNVAALVLAMANVGMLFGDVGFGKLSDKIHVNILIFVSSGVAALATFFLWGFSGVDASAHGRSLLIAFAFMFGVFDGGFIVLWARMGTFFGERDAAMVYGTLSFGRGLGTVISGPISQALLTLGPVPVLGVGQYGSLVAFVGICMALSAIMGPLATAALWWKSGEKFDSGMYRHMP